MDVGIAVTERGEARFVHKPSASFFAEGGLVQLRVLPIDCNDKAGTTLLSFTDLNLPSSLREVPKQLFNEIPFLQNERLRKAR